MFFKRELDLRAIPIIEMDGKKTRICNAKVKNWEYQCVISSHARTTLTFIAYGFTIPPVGNHVFDLNYSYSIPRNKKERRLGRFTRTLPLTIRTGHTMKRTPILRPKNKFSWIWEQMLSRMHSRATMPVFLHVSSPCPFSVILGNWCWFYSVLFEIHIPDGQTGSGKTHTMMGVQNPPAAQGLIPRICMVRKAFDPALAYPNLI